MTVVKVTFHLPFVIFLQNLGVLGVPARPRTDPVGDILESSAKETEKQTFPPPASNQAAPTQRVLYSYATETPPMPAKSNVTVQSHARVLENSSINSWLFHLILLKITLLC